MRYFYSVLVLAGKYAGLGTIGYNHTLLTGEYGPRVRLVSVLTGMALPPDLVLENRTVHKTVVPSKIEPG